MEPQTIIGKAMGNSLRLQILDELVKGPKTLEDLSANISLKPESFIHHIRILQQIGLVEEFEPVRSGGPGRPYSRFRLTGKTVGVQYPPRNYYLLSEILIQNLSEILDAEEAKTRLRRIGETLGGKIVQTLSSKYDVDDWTLDKIRKYFVEGYLRDAGLQPEVIASDKTKLHYRQYNCLFLELAKKHQELTCTLSEGIIDGLLAKAGLETDAARLKCLALNDSCCEYLVKLKQ